jgi:molybdenum-dependent DNA-binding transcriptional regulator ModE
LSADRAVKSPDSRSAAQPRGRDEAAEQQLDEYRGHKADFARVEKQLDRLHPKRMKVLVVLQESGSSLQQCSDRTGVPESTLRTILSDLNKLFDEELYFTRKEGGYKLTDRGNHVAEVFRQILDMQQALFDQRQGLLVRYFPHHGATVLPAAARLRPDYAIELSVLGEHHRSIGHFISRALRPLVAGSHDVVIGIDLPDISGVADLKETLQQRILYTAWLEVMVPVEPIPGVDVTAFVHGDRANLHDLQAAKVEVLTPPADTRSRSYLDRALDPNTELKVAMTEFESKILVIGAYAGLGLPILPSDVALQFDCRHDNADQETYRGPLAGDQAARWRWLPLVTEDGKRISYHVAAHYRSEPSAEPMRDLFLRELEDTVRDVMVAAGRSEALDIDVGT